MFDIQRVTVPHKSQALQAELAAQKESNQAAQREITRLKHQHSELSSLLELVVETTSPLMPPEVQKHLHAH
jgi:iron-sulfur cluster repair protein YtfE (RIC family)